MRLACELAGRGEGTAEPNPMVGCVIAHGETVLAEGWHRAFGGDHAEVDALRRIRPEDQSRLCDATMYVTLEPCCHQGKTPPCTQAILDSGIRRVLVARSDPFAKVQGQGISQLRDAGVQVEVGACEGLSTSLLAPYLKLLTTGKPWVIAKWAMTLDGKIACRERTSKWISSSYSRDVVHRIRGRMDGILVGIETALADDPLLTARPPGPRLAARIIADSQARLPCDCQLLKSIDQAPVLLCVGPDAPADRIAALRSAGAEILQIGSEDPNSRIDQLLNQLGQRRMTNLLVEGGSALLGTLFDMNAIDEVHIFIAPKLIGGQRGVGPLSGMGRSPMSEAITLPELCVHTVDDDIYVSGRIAK